MPDITISVVIPAYNAAKYLAQTLQSVLQQTHKPAEIIVVDDGSTDNTADIARGFGSSVTVYTVPNGRQSTARNFGVNKAGSTWIAFVDADDLWVANKLELQVQEIAAHPEADLCYCGMMWMLQQGDTTVLDREHVFVPPASIKEALLRDVCFLPSTVLIKRESFLEIGGFNPQIIYGNEDHELWLRMRRAGKVMVARPEPLMHYRRHATNTSKSLPWLREGLVLFKTHIFPELPWLTRRLRYNSYCSDHEADVAYTLRIQGDPRCLAYMTASLMHRPFHEPYRYKVCAHMLYSRLLR